MSIVICHHYNQSRPNIYNRPKKIIKKPKVTNDTLIYNIVKENNHGVGGAGIFIKNNFLNTQKQLYVSGQLLWFKNNQLKLMKRKLKKVT